MSRRYVFICDGCDERKESAAKDIPTYWADIDLSADGYTNWMSGGSALQEVRALLCGPCQLRLREAVDPKQWTRMAQPEDAK